MSATVGEPHDVACTTASLSLIEARISSLLSGSLIIISESKNGAPASRTQAHSTTVSE
jgi:nickel-dependent lactate racemase